MPSVKEHTLLHIKRMAYTTMEPIVYKHSGIIYGGYVRDTLISKHFTALYREKNNFCRTNDKKFWDMENDPATQDRCLLPSDMDTCFKDLESADAFIEALEDVSQYQKIRVQESSEETAVYYSPLVLSVRKVCIKIKVCEIPFVCEGSTIKIYVDVVVPKANVTMQAPFGQLDFLCNGFIMSEEYGVTYSRSTGTIIDTYSDAKKAMVVSKIMDDLLNFKTYMCFISRNKSYFNHQQQNINALKRIQKMAKRNKPWSFINMPFKTEIYNTEEEVAKCDCSICYCEFNHADKVAYTITTKEDGTEIPCGKIHFDCFMKSLCYQVNNKSVYSSQGFVFKCPFRNTVDFKTCKFEIKSAYVSK